MAVTKLNTDVVIAGGGPAGCTLARELSAKGKQVILCEKGNDSEFLLGNGLGVVLRLEKQLSFPLPLKKTKEGDTIILAKCLGGGTLLYAGAASLPDLEYWKKYGIELEQGMIDEAARESWVNLPPDEFIGPGTNRVWEAANELGFPFEKQLRHVDFSKCRPGCAYCLNGCRQDGKWTAREYAREAIQNGATILLNTEVNDVIIEDGVAVGIRAKGNGKNYEINAKTVVCAAGGTHTARIMQRSGFPRAGSWFTGDPTFFTYGFVKDGPGNTGEHSMTVGWRDEEHHVLFCSMISPKIAWHMQIVQDEKLRGMANLHRYGKVLGMFAKMSDGGTGTVSANGDISKTFTAEDKERFEYSRDINIKVLNKAGCDPNDMHHSSFIMGHPSGTVRIGELLDTNLETEVKNLYCCDTSIFPEAPGMPPALTVVVLAKRLAKRLETIV